MSSFQYRYLDEGLERATPGEIRSLQLGRLRALLERTWAGNAFYGNRWRAAGAGSPDIASIEDFAAHFPIIRKQDFLADQEEAPPYGLRAAPALAASEPMIVMTTSGTSGQGVELHLETMREREATTRVSDFMYQWSGLERGDRIFLMFPISMLGGGRIEIHGLESYGLTVFPVGNYDVNRKIDLYQRFKPHALLGTTSYLGHLSAVGAERMRDWRPKVLFGGGEGGGYSWFERLQGEWDAPIFNQYGATQTRVDSMFTCEHGIGTRGERGVLHNIDPYVLFEVIDPDTGEHVADGEAGEIVVTSLLHTDVPLIRCGMKDRAIYRAPGTCACGRSFAGVEVGSIARIDDMVKVKGINVWPQAVDDVLNQIGGMDDYQIVVASDGLMRDVITARIMPTSESADRFPGLAEGIERQLHNRIGISFGVEIVGPGTLARSEYKARRWVDGRGRTR